MVLAKVAKEALEAKGEKVVLVKVSKKGVSKAVDLVKEEWGKVEKDWESRGIIIRREADTREFVMAVERLDIKRRNVQIRQ